MSNIGSLSRDSIMLSKLLTSVFREKRVPLELIIASLSETLAQHVSATGEDEFIRTRDLVLKALGERMNELFQKRHAPVADVQRPEFLL